MSTVSEKLLQVAQNNPKVYHSGQLDIVKNAECLKGSKSGSTILIDDVSPVEHEMGVKIRGKNLFDINGFINLTYNSTYYGINDNGELYVKQSDYRDDTVIPAFVTLEAGTYTLSSTTPITFNFKLINLTDNTVISFNNNITFSIEKVTSLGIKCYQSADTVIGKLQLELGTTATSYAPYVPDLTAVKVSRLGFNLWDEQSEVGGINIATGINQDTVTTQIRSKNYIRVQPSTDYYIKCPNTTLAGGMIQIYRYDKNMNYLGYGSTGVQNQALKMGANWAYIRFVVRTDYGTQYNNDICINFNDESRNGKYEPYEGETYTPNNDGTVNGVTSLYPSTTLTTDTDGVLIDCEYYKDIDKTFNELTTSVALSGGDS